ncbi:MAG: aspartate--ammonia ligase, partial [Candidatus Eisenbacteria bacterium]
MADKMDKKADLAGPGVSTYPEVEKILPSDYRSILDPKETQIALRAVKRYVEDNLNKELNLFTVEVPLIVTRESGVNDYLDRDGSRTPVEFPCGLGLEKRLNAQVVQAATKWKRLALAQFKCNVGEGINTDMRAVRKDYFLDHDHSSYVDQWDWERVITPEQRNLNYLKDTVRKLWKVIKGAETFIQKEFPKLKDPRYPNLPDELVFLHAEEILDMYPDLPRKARETAVLQKYPAIFI